MGGRAPGAPPPRSAKLMVCFKLRGWRPPVWEILDPPLDLGIILIGRSKGVSGMCAPQGPNSFIFIQFLVKKIAKNRLAHPLWELAPPQENPGSATGSDSFMIIKWPIS